MAGQLIKDKGKVFRDPVHRLIRIEKDDQFVLDLINTPEFQRLRRVRQLGVSSLTYHGAEHSRFVHSVGVFSFAQRIISALRRRYGETHEVSKYLGEHDRVAKAAALLHDIGHGPFSHMIERASGNSFDHEDMTARLITHESSSIPGVLASHGIKAKDVADIISKVYPHRLVVDIVSSQLDADRMDYLLRDSLMTGVEYGVYDAEWLLNAMCVCRDPTADEDPPQHGWRLCLDRDRGLFTAEQLILARHHMMLQVYMHRVTRGYEVMLLSLFRHAASLSKGKALPEGTPPSVVAYFSDGIHMPHSEWLAFDETAVVSAFQAWDRSAATGHDRLKRLSQAFLRRDRIYQGFALSGVDTAKGMELSERLTQGGLVKNLDWELDNGEHLPYKGIQYTAAKGGGHEEESSLSILLGNGDPTNRGRAVESASLILKGLDNSPQSVARLYVDRDKLKIAEPILKQLGIPHGGEV
jgi:HD superfamily phosphohydrolase